MRTAILALALTTALSSCETESPAGYSTRETLPNGAVLVRYPDLPAIDAVGPDVTEAQLDLQFGSVDGTDPNLIFADIRGIQAASDGTIYVLDFQAIQVRAYDPGGQYLRTVVRGGEGPGEISAANGILLSGDTLLWVHDHGKWTIIGVDPVGEEVHRFGKPIMSYGYIWNGVFDDRGRYWRHTFHQEGGFTSAEGDYLGSVRLAFRPARGRVWVQHGNIYTWVADELDVPYVVRAPLSSTADDLSSPHSPGRSSTPLTGTSPGASR